MPAWLANLLKVEVQAPIYGLVLAVPSSITRLPSAEALAVPLNGRLANSNASRAITKRMDIPSKSRHGKNVNVISETTPEPLRGCIVAMYSSPRVAPKDRGTFRGWLNHRHQRLLICHHQITLRHL